MISRLAVTLKSAVTMTNQPGNGRYPEKPEERKKDIPFLHVLRKAFFIIRGILRLLFILANNLYCIPTHVTWLFLLQPLQKFAPELYNSIEGFLFSSLLAMVSVWSYSAGYDLVEQGDDITRCLDRRTLVVANHQSTSDVPLLMSLMNARQSQGPGNVLHHVMWIMDRMFRYTNFGVVSSYHRDFFIASVSRAGGAGGGGKLARALDWVRCR